jgi:ferritin-like metal-binding protein YciE
MVEEEPEISRETILKTFAEDLGKRKICVRFVPQCLTDELKAQDCKLFKS